MEVVEAVKEIIKSLSKFKISSIYTKIYNISKFLRNEDEEEECDFATDLAMEPEDIIFDEAEIGEGPESNMNTSSRWSRPPLPESLDPKKDTITFQQIDIDHYTSATVLPNMPGAQVRA